MVYEPLRCKGRQSAAQDTGQRAQIENHWSVDERMFGEMLDCSLYLINLFPEFQIPYLHFFLLTEKAGLRGYVRGNVHNPPPSQIASHLNKVPITIQSLSLHIGDRQHERHLFRF